jgi:hypothetical protein
MSDTEQSDLSKVQKAVDELGEHFDTVQILVTRHESTKGGTINVALGTGNWHARYGQVRTWLVAQDERTRIDTRYASE